MREKNGHFGRRGGARCGYGPVTSLTFWTGEIPDTAGHRHGHGNPFRHEGHLIGRRHRMRLLCACAVQFPASGIPRFRPPRRTRPGAPGEQHRSRARHSVHAGAGGLARSRLAPAQLRVKNGDRRHAQVEGRRLQAPLAGDDRDGRRHQSPRRCAVGQAGAVSGKGETLPGYSIGWTSILLQEIGLRRALVNRRFSGFQGGSEIICKVLKINLGGGIN